LLILSVRIFSLMSSILINFIPLEFRKNPKLRKSLLLILSVNLGILIYALVISSLFRKIGFNYGVNIGMATIVASLVFFGLTRYNKRILLNGFYFTFCSLGFFTSICLGTGGIHSPYLLWFLTIPAAIFFYIEKKYALPMVFLTVGCMILVASSNILEINIANPLPERILIFLSISNFTIMTFMLIHIVQTFRQSYQYVHKKLSKTVEQLEISNEDLQNFAYIASHDLQTPLKSINSTIKALKMHYKSKNHQTDPMETQCLEFVENNTGRLATLVEEILNYSRAGQFDPQWEKVNLNEIIIDLRKQVETTGNYPNFVIKNVELPIIITDRMMINQIFQNIIENGLKYNESNHPAIFIEQVPERDFHHLTFSDNGIGIKPEDHNKVFGMFKRVGETQNYQGTGIGLAICKRIIDQSGGKIWLSSKLGEGTVFHVEIPKRIKTQILSSPKNSLEENKIKVEQIN